MTVKEFNDEKSAEHSGIEADVTESVAVHSAAVVKQCCVCFKNGSKCYEAASR